MVKYKVEKVNYSSSYGEMANDNKDYCHLIPKIKYKVMKVRILNKRRR